MLLNMLPIPFFTRFSSVINTMSYTLDKLFMPHELWLFHVLFDRCLAILRLCTREVQDLYNKTCVCAVELSREAAEEADGGD